MDNNLVCQVVRNYRKFLLDYVQIPTPAPFDEGPGCGKEPQLRHLLTMCDEIEDMVARQVRSEDAREKMMRWLGFMQGVLWSLGLNTLNELREHNSPGCEPKKP